MPEIRLYDLGRERLHELLHAAGDPEGATLLIPDLQRPYVWKPSDVVTLVDSLLRGWPFGTLLLWSIGRVREEADERIIPARTFWRRVDRTESPTESAYREKLGKLLEELEVPETKRSVLCERLAELVSVIGDLKDTEVSFLCVRPPPRDADEAEHEQYDDAVVSIFTRLNTGGMRLTDQEVLFAWIKKKWDPLLTNHASADACFDQLQVRIKEESVDLDTDDLVRGVATIWSAIANDGVLLTERQFRRGADLGSVAPWMAQRWERIAQNAVATVQTLGAVGLEHRRHFESLNSLYTFWAWRFVASEWAKHKASKDVAREAVVRAIDDRSRQMLTRWMLIPQWAGRWQEATGFQNYVRDLGRLWQDLSSTSDWDQAVTLWTNRMDSWLTDTRDDADKFVNSVHAERRNTVRRYHGLLWAWQNLDPERSRLARINLTMSSRAAMETDVDHVVSYHQWETEFAPALGPGETIDGIADGANALGNMLLLAKNFNISKSAKPLKTLLGEVYEFRFNNELLADFCKALVLDDVLLDATGRPIADIRSAVAARSKRIRDDLSQFIRGKQDVQDVEQIGTVEIKPWQGSWEIQTVDKSETWSGTMKLEQDGDRLFGTYAPDCTIEAIVYQDAVEGDWVEPKANGRFKWWLTGEGQTFDGTWGGGGRKRGRGSWSGKRR